MKKFCFLLSIILIAGNLFSQDTLPRFSLVTRGNSVTISWTNPYFNLIQLNVQRSYDSLKNYSTIFSATSPELPQNGYTDQNMPSGRMFYRIFYVLQGGTYFFTKAERAGSQIASGGQSNVNTPANNTLRDVNIPGLEKIIPGDKRVVTIMIKDTIFKQLSINSFRNFRDSILHLTKDTLFAYNDSLVGISPFRGGEFWKASSYIYANREGYINLSLPAIGDRKYHIKFFEENGSPLFEIKTVKESPLIIDKSNFVHSGWFRFELYEDNKLIERNKFYLPKDF